MAVEKLGACSYSSMICASETWEYWGLTPQPESKRHLTVPYVKNYYELGGRRLLQQTGKKKPLKRNVGLCSLRLSVYYHHQVIQCE